MERVPWPIFGDDKRKLQEIFLSLYETDEAIKVLFDALQENVHRHSGQDVYLPALEEQYQSTLDELVMHLSPNTLLLFALKEHLREWVDNEIYRTLGYPSMPPYGQRQAHFLPDNPAEFGPQGELYHVLEMREDHRKKIESVLQELNPRQGRGRPRGRTKYFRDAHDFRETIITLMQLIYRKGDGHLPTEELVAECLIEQFTSHPLAPLSAATVNRSPSSMVRHLQMVMNDYGYTWEVLKQLAGIPS